MLLLPPPLLLLPPPLLPPLSPLLGFDDAYRSLYQPPPLNANDVLEINRSSGPPHASHTVFAGSLIRCSYSNSRLHALH